MVNLIDFIMDLFRDPVAASNFVRDPATTLNDAGLAQVTRQQVESVAATVVPAGVVLPQGDPVVSLQRTVADHHGLTAPVQTAPFFAEQAERVATPLIENPTPLPTDDVAAFLPAGKAPPPGGAESGAPQSSQQSFLDENPEDRAAYFEKHPEVVEKYFDRYPEAREAYFHSNPEQAEAYFQKYPEAREAYYTEHPEALHAVREAEPAERMEYLERYPELRDAYFAEYPDEAAKTEYRERFPDVEHTYQASKVEFYRGELQERDLTPAEKLQVLDHAEPASREAYFEKYPPDNAEWIERYPEARAAHYDQNPQAAAQHLDDPVAREAYFQHNPDEAAAYLDTYPEARQAYFERHPDAREPYFENHPAARDEFLENNPKEREPYFDANPGAREDFLEAHPEVTLDPTRVDPTTVDPNGTEAEHRAEAGLELGSPPIPTTVAVDHPTDALDDPFFPSATPAVEAVETHVEMTTIDDSPPVFDPAPATYSVPEQDFSTPTFDEQYDHAPAYDAPEPDYAPVIEAPVDDGVTAFEPY